MTETTELKEKKDDLHKKIDDYIGNIIKHTGNIFESIKFNESQIIEECNNLELLTNTESVANRIQDLLKIVYDMKADCLKRSDYSSQQRKEQTLNITNMRKDLSKRISTLQENYNYINVLIKEMKTNKFYRYALNNKIDN